MSKHTELGKNGEKIACEYLKTKGHEILVTNFRFEHKEIDIISKKGEILVFSEIKTRSSLNYGFPEEAVTFTKQTLVKAAAANFLETHPGHEKCRFDVISIVMKENKILQIRHFEDAFD